MNRLQLIAILITSITTTSLLGEEITYSVLDELLGTGCVVQMMDDEIVMLESSLIAGRTVAGYETRGFMRFDLDELPEIEMLDSLVLTLLVDNLHNDPELNVSSFIVDPNVAVVEDVWETIDSVYSNSFNPSLGELTIRLNESAEASYLAALEDEAEVWGLGLLAEQIDDHTAFFAEVGEAGSPQLAVYYSPPVVLNPATNVVGTFEPDDSINLTWEDNASGEISYWIQRRYRQFEENVWGLWMTAFETPGNTEEYTDSNLEEGYYQYRVRPTVIDDAPLWAESNVVNVGTIPERPDAFSAVLFGFSDNIELSWIDMSNNESGYAIERREDQGGNNWWEWENIANLDSDTQNYLDYSFDLNLDTQYRISAFNSFGSSVWVEASVIWWGIDDNNQYVPTEHAINKLYPNPFNGSISLEYDVCEVSTVAASIYNLNGQLVREIELGQHNAGTYNHSIELNAVPSGTYFLHLDIGTSQFIERITLLK